MLTAVVDDVMLPFLARQYGHKFDNPRCSDAGTVAECPECGREYIDDFPMGSAVLKSPCCKGAILQRYVRLANEADKTGTPEERLGWKAEE